LQVGKVYLWAEINFYTTIFENLPCGHSFGFKENSSNKCIYLKTTENHFIILVLYVDDIRLDRIIVKLLTETKFMLNSYLDTMDLGDAYVVLRIHFFVTGQVTFLDCLREDKLIKSLKV